MKKSQTGSQVHRTYDQAKTPYERTVDSGVLADQTTKAIELTFKALDPVRLLDQIRRLQESLWRRAVEGRPSGQPEPQSEASQLIARFRDTQCMPGGGEGTDGSVPLAAPAASDVASDRKRRYRRTGKSMGPRNYRTRKDPFEDVREEAFEIFHVEPDMTAKELLRLLQCRHPGEYPDRLLRTLQRRVRQWRAEIILRVDDSWLEDDALDVSRHPVSLHATAVSEVIEPPTTSSEPTAAQANAAVTSSKKQAY